MRCIDTKDAIGHVLCHDITVIVKDVKKGDAFKKGHIVTEADIPELLKLGKDHLYVWEKDDRMLHEDEAAAILRDLCMGQNIVAGQPSEGKIELTTAADGLFTVDSERMQPTKALFANPGSLRAAQLTGCKNISHARKTGEYELEALDWGVRLVTTLPVPEDVRAVGIRAHYLNPRAGRNSHPVRLAGEMEEPFEWILEFRWEGQREGSMPLWWRVPKDRRPVQFPGEPGVSPVNVLPLREP